MRPIAVLRAGLLTTVQDWPGRTGLWHVGVPPSGPMDDLSFRLGNTVLGNPEGAAGLECTRGGPALRFADGARVAVTGAPVTVTLDGRVAPMWQVLDVPADGVLDVGAPTGPGMRTYVLVAGGLSVEPYLGSGSTFLLGAFGGHHGRRLADGDTLQAHDAPAASAAASTVAGRRVPDEHQPALGHCWSLAVTEGPHGAPDFFTRADMVTLFATDFEVHFNSDRTGVRLVGPKPHWARTDGGEAGLHPSNIHDNAYCVGALDFTGDTPILLGPDGPSLGGFVCPVTVTVADRWKLGQLAPGDSVRFVAVRAERAAPAAALDLRRRASLPAVVSSGGDGDGGLLSRHRAVDGTEVTLRRAGDAGVLLEYGPMALDLAVRARVHALHQQLLADAAPGIAEATPGVRSLQVQAVPGERDVAGLAALLVDADAALGPTDTLVVPSRTVDLPLSFDDPRTHDAVERYMHGVRADAPWCPDNIEFIRRINGLGSRDDVRDIVFAADYLVLGLGDVYLGAPVATPLDPRHRLVTTKYNPARTWTPENAVGIGGAYLCVYGMEGPGGYQFVGRTTQVWRHGPRPDAVPADDPDPPWLLRYFDRIRFHPVSPAELRALRSRAATGETTVAAQDGEFALADYLAFVDAHADAIAAFRRTQGAAFAAERAAWDSAGEFARR